jgi:hypothetical protein
MTDTPKTEKTETEKKPRDPSKCCGVCGWHKVKTPRAKQTCAERGYSDHMSCRYFATPAQAQAKLAELESKRLAREAAAAAAKKKAEEAAKAAKAATPAK